MPGCGESGGIAYACSVSVTSASDGADETFLTRHTWYRLLRPRVVLSA